MLKSSSNKAFTFVELLVVMSMISILSVTVLTGLNSRKQKARDAIRVNDIKGLGQVVETYFAEHYEFPATQPDKRVPRALLQEYFEAGVFPEDQQPNGYGYFYERIDNPKGYCLGVQLEHLPQQDDDLCGMFEVNYKIKGP